MSCAGYRLSTSKEVTFIQKWKWWINNIFAFLCIFDGFLNLGGCFFCGKFTKLCRHARTFQLVLSSCQNFPTGPLRHPAPSLGHWYTGVYLRIFDPGPSNSTTFLELCFPGDYRQSIESPMGVPTFNPTEKSLTFTIYDCILRIRPKRCVIWRKLALWTSNEFSMRHLLNELRRYTGFRRPKG